MQKLIKITTGSLLAAALMVGCNNGTPQNNESLMDDAVNDTEDVIERDRDIMDDRNVDNLDRDNDMDLRDDEDLVDDKIDRKDRDKRNQ